LARNTSTKRRVVTIHPPARLVGEPRKKKEGRTTPKQWQTGYSPRPHTSSDQNQTLHGGWPAVCSYTVKCDPNWSWGYSAVGGRKWPFPITLASGLYNSLDYRTSRDLNSTRTWHNSAADFFAFWKISAANFRILWRHLTIELRGFRAS